MTGATCQQLLVTCPSVPNVYAYIKTNTPSNPIGTVLYGTGTDGNGNYDTIFTFGKTAVQNVYNAGFRTVQISWGTPYNTNQPGGWVEGPGGVLAASCRWATVANYVYTKVQNNTSKPMCATANSGGAGALAYVLSQYPNNISMAEVTSGPPTARLDWGCMCKEGKLNDILRKGLTGHMFRRHGRRRLGSRLHSQSLLLERSEGNAASRRLDLIFSTTASKLPEPPTTSPRLT